MSEPLTLQDWETLFNMVKAGQASDKELREQIAQLEERLKQSEARIPKTGLFSHSMLTRILTVCGYVFFAAIIWNLFVALLGVWQAILFPAIAIILLVIMVIMAKKAKQIENDIGMDAHLKTLRN
jgi:hypothetical protein